MDNSQRLVVVTGGSKGIGKAIVSRFASEGFSVATCSRNENDLEDLKNELGNEAVGSIHTTVADLSKKDGAEHFIEFVRLIAKPVTVLVNNSGRFVPGLVHEENEGVLEDMINTNLYSAYHLTRGLIDDMISQGHGHIFNMCSTASIMPYVNGGSYCISKYALLGMTKVLREEMKSHNIKVTAIMPGATYTASWEGVDLPEDRFMKAEDVANAVWGAYSMSETTVIEEILMRPQHGDI